MSKYAENHDEMLLDKLRRYIDTEEYKYEAPYITKGDVEVIIRALEKQIPKKTILQRSDEKSLYKCPCCDSIFVEAYENMQRGYIPKFCEMCGQSISFRLE